MLSKYYSKYYILYGLLAGFLSCMTQPSLAQSQTDQAMQQLQQQIQSLQDQLKAIQKQVAAQQAATKQVQAQVQATPIKPLPPGVEIVTVAPNGGVKIGPVTVKAGGFIEGDSVFRTRNQTSDVGSTFGGIPFANVPSSHETEYRLSGRGSRLSLLAQAGWNDQTNLSAYYESDFIGTGVTSNSGESNSYVPRLRQAYATVDRANGWHFEAGQAWSLVTGFKDGLVPRDENIPLTLDHQYVPGFNWRRVPQLRLTKTFSPALSVGFSLESPQAGFAGTFPGAKNGVPELVTTVQGTGSGGGTLNNCITGGSISSTTTVTDPDPKSGATATTSSTFTPTNCANYSVDIAPDMVLKAALDPGWGHYEVFGLGRIFQTRAQALGLGQSVPENNTTWGGGGGGNLILPVVPKLINFQASVLAGQGIGQYGAAQFGDVTVNQFGEPSPIPMIQGLTGLVAHPAPNWDVFFYGGAEKAFKDTFGPKQQFGYGSPLDVNTGCNIENSAANLCAAKNELVWQLTGGLWDRLYQGKAGTVSVGLQYSYTQREAFDGIGGGPTANDQMVFASFRYYPFQ